MSPTQLSLQYLRKRGWRAQVVERWNVRAKVRHDLFGCIDIVAVHPEHFGVLGVQATTRDHQAQRLDKAREQPGLRTWLEAANGFEVWGWAKVGQKGQRKTWQVTRTGIELEELR